MNVLLGPNGSGKTSVLEAIGYASTLRSFRRSPDGALVNTDAAEAIIRVGIESRSGDGKIEISLRREGRRRVLLKGKRPRSNSDLADAVPAVAFLPDDLDLVKGGPGRRRDFVDELAAQLSPSAGAVRAEYGRALRQRNTLLRKQGRAADPATLSVWDERLAEAGAKVVVDRLDLIDRLDATIGPAYSTVAQGSAVRASYVSSWAGDVSSREPEAFKTRLNRALEERRGRDLEVRATSAGPHRDEPTFLLEGRPVRTQASQGEQRSVALALRIGSYRLLEERHALTPILLLDDVFSELDVGRSGGVMEILPKGQVFVTSAREDEVPVAGRRWHVQAGSLQ